MPVFFLPFEDLEDDLSDLSPFLLPFVFLVPVSIDRKLEVDKLCLLRMRAHHIKIIESHKRLLYTESAYQTLARGDE